MMMSMLLNLAKTKAGTLAKVTGKSPEEIKQALSKGAELLPELNNLGDDGVGILKKHGIPAEFIRDMKRKYGKYASKFGINLDSVERVADSIERRSKSTPSHNDSMNREQRRSSTKFNASKYRK